MTFEVEALITTAEGMDCCFLEVDQFNLIGRSTEDTVTVFKKYNEGMNIVKAKPFVYPLKEVYEPLVMTTEYIKLPYSLNMHVEHMQNIKEGDGVLRVNSIGDDGSVEFVHGHIHKLDCKFNSYIVRIGISEHDVTYETVSVCDLTPLVQMVPYLE